uniref:Uncharacterized protein n=1 Tax=Oryza punctata TaxID=4537 RepID=A0A0E0LF92_ORYPU
MAILSLPKDCLDRIKEDVSLGVVSIWQANDITGSKECLRSGFVVMCELELDMCLVLTLGKDLDNSRKTFVRFENGECFEAFGMFTDTNKKSNLVAMQVAGLSFEPKMIIFSEHEAKQCDEVVHLGCLSEESAKLNISSGSIGIAGHRNKKGCTGFSHCCSEKLHLLGGPVFNLYSKLVGVNYSQLKGKNLFFAMDLTQLRKDMEMLFGKNMNPKTYMWRRGRRHNDGLIRARLSAYSLDQSGVALE